MIQVPREMLAVCFAYGAGIGMFSRGDPHLYEGLPPRANGYCHSHQDQVPA